MLRINKVITKAHDSHLYLCSDLSIPSFNNRFSDNITPVRYSIRIKIIFIVVCVFGGLHRLPGLFVFFGGRRRVVGILYLLYDPVSGLLVLYSL